jgi:hypothetical protein
MTDIIEWCNAKIELDGNPDNIYCCNRPKGHDGFHTATRRKYAVVWE